MPSEAFFIAASLLLAVAQDAPSVRTETLGEIPPAQTDATASVGEIADGAADGMAGAVNEVEGATATDADNSADDLNARQQINQSFTLQRSINGTVVETETRSVTFDRGAPVLDTEAGVSALEAMKASFDRAVLTRQEAFEEAKLDFALADLDRDGALTLEEFLRLAALWREANKTADGDSRLTAPESAVAPDATDAARHKFQFIAGAADTIDQKTYIREAMTDFTATDVDGDGVIRDEQLAQFRAAIAGFTLSM